MRMKQYLALKFKVRVQLLGSFSIFLMIVNGNNFGGDRDHEIWLRDAY